MLLGWATFLLSLPMVAIDSKMGGELLRGFEVRGYQCFLGAFVAPLALPFATPLWLVIAVGNLTAVLAPLVRWWPALARFGRISLTLGAACAVLLSMAGARVGVVRLYPGYWVWCSALLALALGFWVARGSPSRPRAAAS
ncbi:MAG: hypothetical protein ACRD3C_11025 [Vicinamibacterales bacterium]